MKTLFFLLTAFILTGCSTSWDPPPIGYEKYKRYKTNDEQIKQDMRECSFPDVRDTAEYSHYHENDYVASNLCMEKKGYITGAGKKGICSVYTETEACQKHLREKQK